MRREIYIYPIKLVKENKSQQFSGPFAICMCMAISQNDVVIMGRVEHLIRLGLGAKTLFRYTLNNNNKPTKGVHNKP